MFKKVILVFLILLILPLRINSSLAVNYLTTESFISDLKTKIINIYKVDAKDIVIEWKDTPLEKKIFEIQKVYSNNEVSIKIKDALISNIAGKTSLPIDVFVDGKLNRILFVRCKIDILKTVLVAKNAIQKDELITEDNVEYSKVSINTTFRDNKLLKLEDILGKVTVTSVAKNAIINLNLLKNKVVILKGNQVSIRLINGDLTLLGTGLALEDGYVGKMIRVKVINFSSNKEVSAKVIDNDLVEVDLGGW